jgi:hypothetical protein
VSGVYILVFSLLGGAFAAVLEITRYQKSGSGYPVVAFLLIGLATFAILMVSGVWNGKP